MDTGKKPSVTDEHDTNQNEAASNIVRLVDQTPIKNKSLAEVEDIHLNVAEASTAICDIMPSIVVTPASPDLYGNDHKIEFSTEGDVLCKIPSVTSITGVDISMLSMPQNDSSIDISQPFENCSKCSIDTCNDEDLVVICRCSSTPIKDPSRSRQDDDEEGDCSIFSIDDTSPIVKSNDITDECRHQAMPTNPVKDNNEQITRQKLSYLNSQENIILDTPSAPPQTSHRVTGTPHPLMNEMNCGRTPMTHNPNIRQHDGDSMAGLSSMMYTQPNYNQAGMTHNDYYPSSDNSWTDMSYRSQMSPVPTGSMTANNCYNMMNTYGPSSGISDPEYFVYPSIYVSSAGLISVLLRNDMSVEMTIDRTIRVVSHHHMMAVATDSRGTAASIYHPAVKIFQVGTTTDIATDTFRSRMGSGDTILFSNGHHFFKLEDSELQPTPPVKFSDIGRDQSVNLLFSSEGYGESLVSSCMQVAAQAEYANLPKGGVIIRINGVKVTQTGSGDVSVVTGAKFIRLSPHYGTTRLGNRFVDIEVEKDWTVKLTRGSHSFISSRKRSMVCNGKMEAGFDENNGLKVANLMPRHPLLTEAGMVRRSTRKPARLMWQTSPTPRRKPDDINGAGRGGRTF